MEVPNEAVLGCDDANETLSSLSQGEIFSVVKSNGMTEFNRVLSAIVYNELTKLIVSLQFYLQPHFKCPVFDCARDNFERHVPSIKKKKSNNLLF